MDENPSANTGDRQLRRFWYPAALTLLTLVTIAGFLTNLSANGWANSFYAAAVQAGSQNWEAFLFGSLDSANAITVDKPPASLWVMALSARVFGFSSFSMLLPQVLLAGASVLLVAHSTRLALHGHTSATLERLAALGAGLVLALSPITALMFRFNNPDALLVTLMAAAVVATQHGLKAVGSTPRTAMRDAILWLGFAGICLGFGFLTKQFQVLLIVPGLAVAWVLFARRSWLHRCLLLLVPIASMVISAGWWIALVELTPAADRPYVGGSQNNSFLELTFGYNGFGRLTGNEAGSVGGGGGGQGGGGWGETGIARLLTGSFGAQIAWLLPTALLLLAVIVVLLIRAEVARRRRDRSTHLPVARTSGSLEAAVMMWGAWLVVTWLVLSNMNGIVHEYYTVALVPAIAVILALGVALLLTTASYGAMLLLALAWALTGAWQFILTASMSGIPGWLRWGVLMVSILGALLLIGTGLRFRAGQDGLRCNRALMSAVASMAVIASLVIPAQLSVRTIAASTEGSIVTIAGTNSGMGGPGGGGGGPA
ncbi:MAG: ArnT family glycosyltransferase, partial [Brevibacterium aurantiacum]